MKRLENRIMLFSIALILAVSAAAAWTTFRTLRHFTDTWFVQRAESLAKVVQVGFPLNERALRRTKEAVGAELLVGDDKGHLLLATLPESGRAVAAFAFAECARRLESASPGSVLPVSIDAAGYRFVFPVSAGPWTLGVAYPLSDVARLEKETLWPVIVTTVLLALAGIAVSVLFVRALTRPLQKFVDETKRISRGEFDAIAIPSGTEEIQTLAAAFNTMTEGLQRYREELVRAERLETLGKMSAGLAHEIRNPLSALGMMLQMVRKDGRAAPFTEELSRMASEIGRLEKTVRDVLSFAGPMALERRAVSLNDIAREAVELLRPEFDHQGAALEIRLSHDAPVIDADAARVKQAVLNLLLNALQATEGRGAVRLETDRDEKEFRATLAVLDNGKGIPEDARSRVFEPFFTTKSGGAGLGLAVAKRIADVHGGKIEFKTGFAGTRFQIAFPLYKTVNP